VKLPVRLVVAALASLATTGVTGCSSGSDDASSSTTTLAPEDVLVPNAQVTRGLATLRVTFEEARDAVVAESATVDELGDDLQDQWFAIEGRIKKNDELSYVAFEDALALMATASDDGDGSAAQRALEQFDNTADSYLARFP
jgi:hypothetical protein